MLAGGPCVGIGFPLESTRSALKDERMSSVFIGPARFAISLSIACSRALVRASSSCVSWIYSFGGRGMRGGGGGIESGIKVSCRWIPFIGGSDACLAKGEDMTAACVVRSSASYIAFSRAFSSSALSGCDPLGAPGPGDRGGIGCGREPWPGGEGCGRPPTRGGGMGAPNAPSAAASCASKRRRNISFSAAASVTGGSALDI